MRITLIILFLISTSLVNAQEVLINLASNPSLEKAFAEKKLKKQSKTKSEPIELPFFDDFSFSETYPTEKLWLDSAVFINTSYAINPPTIGVATFDAINKKGEIHENVIPNVTRLSDTLTSKAINLNYPGNMSVYLSFFYQPQGNGDIPQSTDTLVLEFYSPTTDKWTSVWKAIYYSPTYVKEIYQSSEKIWQPETSPAENFKAVILPVLGSDYLVEGFQFRFKNYVSITGTIPSKIGNGDFWNIDYVLLNKDRNANDTIMHDIAFLQASQSLLADYESIPWRHYVNNSTKVKTKEFIQINYKNNDNLTRTIDSMYIIFRDTLGLTPSSKLEASASNIGAAVEMNPELPIGGYFFPTHSSKKAVFDIQVKLVTSSLLDPHENNITHYYQKFYNYYAYDDGIPELGYGITGSGSKNAMLAYQFTTLMTDTLRSIDMYFNRSYNNESQKYFDLVIWDDNDGQPGDIIYKQAGNKPEYTDALNQFNSYSIADTSEIILTGTFYVGWIQTSEALLNIGYDINRDAQDKIFYNINGDWLNSSYTGALMIRPVFRKEILTSINETEIIETGKDFLLYPNPAKDFLKIKFEDNYFDETQISIFDLSGKLILKEFNYHSEETIKTQELTKGIYIIKLQNSQQNVSKKLIIN